MAWPRQNLTNRLNSPQQQKWDFQRSQHTAPHWLQNTTLWAWKLTQHVLLRMKESYTKSILIDLLTDWSGGVLWLKLTVLLHNVNHCQADDGDLEHHLIRQAVWLVLGGTSRCQWTLFGLLAEHAQVEVVQSTLTDLLHVLGVRATHRHSTGSREDAKWPELYKYDGA